MTSPVTGAKVANQFIIIEESGIMGNFDKRETFQSYDSIIAVKTYWGGHEVVTELDEKYWDYSRTTSKYRNQFLEETTEETKAKIKSGQYKLVNLN